MTLCPTCALKNTPRASHCTRCGRPLKARGLDDAPRATLNQGVDLADLLPLRPAGETTPAIDEIALAAEFSRDEPPQGIRLESISGALDARISGNTDGADVDVLNPLSVGGSLRGASARNTLVEGLKAVQTPPEPASEAPPADVRVSARAISDLRRTQPLSFSLDAALRPDPKPEPAPKAPRALSNRALAGLLGALVLLLAAAVALFSTLQTSGDGDKRAAERPRGRVLVPAGPYLRGLANDYRLMFSQSCKKMAEDPETECKEEIALKGEVPQKAVDVGAFEIDRVEVANDDWGRCVQAGRCKPVDTDACENWTLQGKMPFRRVPRTLARADAPVVCVTRSEAAAYCAFAGGRLPTPDEWEKAARGRNGYTLPWGTNWNPELSNWGERDMARVSIAGKLDGHVDTAPVGAFPRGASPSGLLDAAGNVAEWVAAEQSDEALMGAARGGSWRSGPLDLRVTARLWVPADARRTDVGFRCAANPSPDNAPKATAPSTP